MRILLHFLGSKGTLAVLVFLALVAMMQLPRSSSSWALGDDASWEELFNASSRGWRPFEPSQRSPGAQEHQHQLTGGQLWPDDCIDAWVARGKLCEQLKEGGLRAQEKVDLLWTYTNGSDPLLQNWRVELTVSRALLCSTVAIAELGDVAGDAHGTSIIAVPGVFEWPSSTRARANQGSAG